MNTYSLLFLAGVLCTGSLFAMKRKTPSDLQNCITRMASSFVVEKACSIVDPKGTRYQYASKLTGETQQGKYILYQLGTAPLHVNLQIFKMLSGQDANKVFAQSYTMNFEEDFTGQYAKMANYIEELISAESE